MKAFRIALHSFVLVAADLFGIAAGALVAFRVTGMANQIWLQLPVAVVLSIAGFLGWSFALRLLKWTSLLPRGSNELWTYFIASLLWAPLTFVPLHYVTQGYLTSLGNLVALALYQAPINAVAVLLASRLGRRTGRVAAELEPHESNCSCHN